MADRLIIGERCIYSTDSSETGLNNNVLVCGGSGCGKTMSVSEPRLLETYSTSLVATVTKRRIVNKYTNMFIRRGFEVLDLNFINPAGSNVCYDPMAYVKSYQDITFLARSIVMANTRKDRSSADPYWDDAAISLLSAEIAYNKMLKPDATFADVLDMHDKLTIDSGSDVIRTSLDSEFRFVMNKFPDSFAAACWKSFKQLPIKTASCVYSALNTCIDSIFTPDIREMIRSNRRIDFQRIAQRRTVLFISTSAVNPALNCFINIFYAQMFKQLFEFAEGRPDGALPVPVHVLCDDFATGSRILNFAEYISIFREKGISVTLLLQSESQLEAMYGVNDATTIINNCDTYLYMGGMDIKTAQNVSLRLNRPLDEVLYMPIGREIVFRRGQRPVVTSRYDICANPLYREVTAEYERRVKGTSRAA